MGCKKWSEKCADSGKAKTESRESSASQQQKKKKKEGGEEEKAEAREKKKDCKTRKLED